MSDELNLTLEEKRAVTVELLQLTRRTVHSLQLQLRAAKIAGDDGDAKALEARVKSFAMRLAVYEEELAELDKPS